jgi:hypothetical protein
LVPVWDIDPGKYQLATADSASPIPVCGFLVIALVTSASWAVLDIEQTNSPLTSSLSLVLIGLVGLIPPFAVPTTAFFASSTRVCPLATWQSPASTQWLRSTTSPS